MTLVERFIEFKHWTTARKSALLYGRALPIHLLCTLSTDWVASQLPWLDRALIARVFWIWNASLLVSFGLSLLAVWQGREGRWTLWINVFPYSAFIVLLISLFGMVSTPFVILYFSVNVLVTVWYSPRDGLLSFLYGLGLIGLYSALMLSGLVPYAPALIERSIEVQTDPLWILHVVAMVLMFFGFCYGLLYLLISAQQMQQQRLTEAQHRLDLSTRLISRYVPSQLADKIIRGGYSESFRPERTKLTMVFSDVEGFTEASDRLDPEDLAALLNEYLSEMMTIAESFGATVNQIVGDGIMMFFGAPQATSDRDHALRAVRMAVEMQRRMHELRDVWIVRGISKPFRIRIGINTGYASVGDYGSLGRKLYSAIGVQTNLAARIQAHCQPGKVLISQATWGLVQTEFECQDQGEVPFKGLNYPVRVCEVVGQAAATRVVQLRRG